MNTSEEITTVLKARLPGIHLRTLEENRALLSIRTAAANFSNGSSKVLWVWRPATGLRKLEIERGVESEVNDPCAFDEACQAFVRATENVILILCDPWDELGRPIYQNHLKRALYEARGTGKAIIITGGDWRIPREIEDQITIVDLQLPNRSELEEYVTALAKKYSESPSLKGKIKVDADVIPDLARALTGMTMDEAKSVVSLAIVKYTGLDQNAVKMAILEKKQIVSRGGFLQYEEPAGGLESVGGLQNLKDWLIKRRSLFSDKARQYGIKAPKGVLLVGVPGTGKTLCARAIASAWACPLVRMDAGRLFGSLVGESEGNLRKAIATAEAVAPCVLMIDELEKAFGGQGGLDGGTSSRVFGGLLSWLQDKKADVFVVATANDVSKLPPELLRKGRFDEIFAADLPDIESREEIMRIHLNKADGGKDIDDLSTCSQISKGFTGAELESVVQAALIESFNATRNLKVEDLVQAIRKTVPLSKTMVEQVNALRSWCKSGRAVPAGKTIEEDAVADNRDKIEL